LTSPSVSEEAAMNVRRLLVCGALVFATGVAAAQDKVVYHINDAKTHALAALRNVRNHLDTDPTAKVIVVAEAFGVDFLMEDVKDRNDVPFAATVSALVNLGVKFEVCDITLRLRNLKREQFILEAGFTPSGVVRLTKLQLQGYAYIKP
jgi:intracellular sulfur oxidation DsrE/DsrF family protein